MNFVLDASITISWCFRDESSEITNQLLDRLSSETAYVPGIWSLEIGNILIAAVRRNKLTQAEMAQFLDLINKLNIHVDDETTAKAFHEILALAHSEGLTTYDASYLELAMRRGLELASKDIQLCKAALKLGVKVTTP